MGIFGAVLATGLAPLISIAIMSGHWMGKNKGFHLAKQKSRDRPPSLSCPWDSPP